MFYVSVIRSDGDYRLLAGPFLTHQRALEMVDVTRAKANDVDPRACWYAFGTCKADTKQPGILNDLLGIEA